MPKQPDEPSRKDMFEQLAKRLRDQAAQPNMHAYEPHLKQLLFHKSLKSGRLYIGGNRSGKSVGGVIEDLWWATRRHPYRQIPDGKVFGRVLGVDFINGVQGILIPIFKRWIIPSDLIGGSWSQSWNLSERTLTLSNGNVLDFKSYDQDLDKHAGTSRNFIHFDEEPPKAVFNENIVRTIDVGGSWWITMTPVQGLTWTYKTLYEPAKKGTNLSLDLIEVDMSDNPFLSIEEKMTVLAFLDDDEKAKREHGQFVPRGGLVYPEFMETVHAVLPADWKPPRNWLVYHSLDHGYNNPTASLHHAVSPKGEAVVTFHEHYEREMIIKDHAKKILEWEMNNKIDPFLRTGDPAMKQRQAQSGSSIQQLYGDEGIYFALDSVPRDVSPGVDKINTYLKVNPFTKRPFWSVTQGCPHLIREMKQLHWEYYTSPRMEDANNVRETIHKKDDHAPDALRYFFTFLPEISPSGLDMLHAPVQNRQTPGTIWEMIQNVQEDFAPKVKWDIQSGFDLSGVPYD